MNEYSKFLCHTMSFLIPIMSNGQPPNGYDYEFTWVNEVPEGWRELFLEKCIRLSDILDCDHSENEFRILEIKEKYGELRIYYTGAECVSEEIDKLFEEARLESKYTCIQCGDINETSFSEKFGVPMCASCQEKLLAMNKVQKRG